MGRLIHYLNFSMPVSAVEKVTKRLCYVVEKNAWSTEKFHLSYKEGFLITNWYLDSHAAMIGNFS